MKFWNILSNKWTCFGTTFFYRILNAKLWLVIGDLSLIGFLMQVGNWWDEAGTVAVSSLGASIHQIVVPSCLFDLPHTCMTDDSKLDKGTQGQCFGRPGVTLWAPRGDPWAPRADPWEPAASGFWGLGLGGNNPGDRKSSGATPQLGLLGANLACHQGNARKIRDYMLMKQMIVFRSCILRKNCIIQFLFQIMS